MEEFFYDERPSGSSSDSGWRGGGVSLAWGWDEYWYWGGYWGLGGGGCGGLAWGWGAADDKSDKEKLSPVRSEGALRVSALGALLVNSDGSLLYCQQECMQAPALSIVIDAEDPGHHGRCIQINLIYSKLRPLYLEPEKTLSYELWPVDIYGEECHYAGRFPLPEPGELLNITASWQRGHHDISEISRMKFTVFGVSCGAKTISRGSWRTIATVTVDDSQHISVSGIRGKLPRAKKEL